ncbi:VOC family protein [Streptomyces sp. NPDC006610]|jgi:predicted enzyme related to lactoylglutathione lyase|uniref:VOC family protein n=1 Tax=Streptomyces sp. NPDC006610 TaxID=3154584 RepID=UPI0033B3AE3A
MLTTRFADGAPNWIDLGTSDLDAATAFYGALFGWRFRSAGPQAGGYGFFDLDGRTAAGGMGLPPDQGSPSWTVYFRSPDAQGTAEAVRRAHGSVPVEPVDVLDRGRMAVLADPAGAAFGVWQPGRLEGLDVLREPGALCWVELYTPDVAAAAAFYQAALGLETAAVTFPGGTYTTVNPAGAGEDAMFGGLVPFADDPAGAEAGPHWLPYFEVLNPDATVALARELHGTVHLPPTDIPDVGRIARLADPSGARFAVIRSEPGQG